MTTAAVNAPVTRAAASNPVHSELNTAKSKTETAMGSMSVTGSSRSRAHPGRNHLNGVRREELERDAVRVAEAQARAVVGVHDAAVADAQLVESGHPSLEFGAVGAAECDMVQADVVLCM